MHAPSFVPYIGRFVHRDPQDINESQRATRKTIKFLLLPTPIFCCWEPLPIIGGQRCVVSTALSSKRRAQNCNIFSACFLLIFRHDFKTKRYPLILRKTAGSRYISSFPSRYRGGQSNKSKSNQNLTLLQISHAQFLPAAHPRREKTLKRLPFLPVSCLAQVVLVSIELSREVAGATHRASIECDTKVFELSQVHTHAEFPMRKEVRRKNSYFFKETDGGVSDIFVRKRRPPTLVKKTEQQVTVQEMVYNCKHVEGKRCFCQ